MEAFRLMKCAGSAEQRGFNLIELGIVLAVTLMLTITSHSKLSDLYNKHYLRSQTDQLFVFLQLARQTALQNFTHVTVCPSSDLSNCNTNWSSTLLAFVDDNRNGKIDGEEQVISTMEAIAGLDVNRRLIHFAPMFSAANTTASLTLCKHSNTRQWASAIILSNMGRIRVEQNQSKRSC